MSKFGSAPNFAIALGAAGALGHDTSTHTATATGVGGGMAVGFSGSSAVAQNHNSTAPQTATTAVAETAGGDTRTHYTNDLTITFHAGSTQVSANISIAVAGAHGFDPLSAHVSTADQFSTIGSLSFTDLH